MTDYDFELITPRLILRVFKKTDLPALFKIYTEPGIARYYPTTTTPDEARTLRSIEHTQRHWEEYGYTKWAVILRETDQLIGRCGLELLTETNEIEVGYLFSHAHWGKGYATEAASASLNYGFNELKMQEIIGLTHPENIASQKVLLKTGMQYLGDFEYFGMLCKKYSKQYRNQEKNESNNENHSG